jgi:hypothetical protein
MYLVTQLAIFRSSAGVVWRAAAADEASNSIEPASESEPRASLTVGGERGRGAFERRLRRRKLRGAGVAKPGCPRCNQMPALQK